MKPVTLSTANQASLIAFAIVTIFIYLLSLKSIHIPNNVSDAIQVLVASIVHIATTKVWKEKPDDPA